ncbi:uncharacterized protein B0H64DRAFT_45842 [Chaetomium fimeti]|uniref:Uncharacterized protein n=1 Tax=Chaetomium fimeti TaxID=1854472 RepID=A0AAE0H7A5_9PEZI|nr:hypothetical protein B0H64DRAFT_45842 [Chaetomium fimeti]
MATTHTCRLTLTVATRWPLVAFGGFWRRGGCKRNRGRRSHCCFFGLDGTIWFFLFPHLLFTGRGGILQQKEPWRVKPFRIHEGVRTPQPVRCLRLRAPFLLGPGARVANRLRPGQKACPRPSPFCSMRRRSHPRLEPGAPLLMLQKAKMISSTLRHGHKSWEPQSPRRFQRLDGRVYRVWPSTQP